MNQISLKNENFSLLIFNEAKVEEKKSGEEVVQKGRQMKV